MKQQFIENAHINIDQSKPGCRNWYILGLATCGQFKVFNFVPCVCVNDKLEVVEPDEYYQLKSYVNQPRTITDHGYSWTKINEPRPIASGKCGLKVMDQVLQNSASLAECNQQAISHRCR